MKEIIKQNMTKRKDEEDEARIEERRKVWAEK